MRHLSLAIRAHWTEPPSLGELGLFLYDLSTLYDLVRLGLDPAYSSFRFGKYPLFRGRRPLSANDRLLVQELGAKSNLRLIGSVGAEPNSAAALVATMNVLLDDLASTYHLSPKSIKRDLSTLERQAKRSGRLLDTAAAQTQLERRGAQPHLSAVLRRLRRSPIQITALSVRL